MARGDGYISWHRWQSPSSGNTGQSWMSQPSWTRCCWKQSSKWSCCREQHIKRSDTWRPNLKACSEPSMLTGNTSGYYTGHDGAHRHRWFKSNVIISYQGSVHLKGHKAGGRTGAWRSHFQISLLPPETSQFPAEEQLCKQSHSRTMRPSLTLYKDSRSQQQWKFKERFLLVTLEANAATVLPLLSLPQTWNRHPHLNAVSHFREIKWSQSETGAKKTTLASLVSWRRRWDCSSPGMSSVPTLQVPALLGRGKSTDLSTRMHQTAGAACTHHGKPAGPLWMHWRRHAYSAPSKKHN